MADRLEEVVTRLRAFVAEREWGQFHDPKNLSMAVASEAGELLAEYRWLASDASDAWSREPGNKRRAAMEAADVGISLLMFCDRIGVDLVEAMKAKIALNAVKYPVAEVRGRHSRGGRGAVDAFGPRSAEVEWSTFVGVTHAARVWL